MGRRRCCCGGCGGNGCMSPLCSLLAAKWNFDGSGFIVSPGPGATNPRALGTNCPTYIIGPCSGGSIAGGDMKYVPSCVWSKGGTICQAPYPYGPPVTCSDPYSTGGLNSSCFNPNGHNSSTYPVKWQAGLISGVSDGKASYTLTIEITDAAYPALNRCTQGTQVFNYTGTSDGCTEQVMLNYIGTQTAFGGLMSVSISPPASVTITPSEIADGGSVAACATANDAYTLMATTSGTIRSSVTETFQGGGTYFFVDAEPLADAIGLWGTVLQRTAPCTWAYTFSSGDGFTGWGFPGAYSIYSSADTPPPSPPCSISDAPTGSYPSSGYKEYLAWILTLECKSGKMRWNINGSYTARPQVANGPNSVTGGASLTVAGSSPWFSVAGDIPPPYIDPATISTLGLCPGSSVSGIDFE